MVAKPGVAPVTVDYADYSFAGMRVHNVKADTCISNHMDVANAEVGRFLAAALNA